MIKIVKPYFYMSFQFKNLVRPDRIEYIWDVSLK